MDEKTYTVAGITLEPNRNDRVILTVDGSDTQYRLTGDTLITIRGLGACDHFTLSQRILHEMLYSKTSPDMKVTIDSKYGDYPDSVEFFRE